MSAIKPRPGAGSAQPVRLPPTALPGSQKGPASSAQQPAQGWLPRAPLARPVVAQAPRAWTGVGSASQAGWLRSRPPPTTDVTARFNEVYASARAGRDTLPPDAKSQHYLMVGGLFTNHYPGYMSGNMARLKSLGLDTQRVPIDSDASVKQNAATIRDAVNAAYAKDGKQVVLIGQSKGGVDVTAALALYPELKSKVRAVVAMQAPYGGTPVATDVADCPQVKDFATGAIKALLKGDPKALLDLSYESRKSFVAAHPYPTDVPTVSLATSRDSARSLLDGTASYMRQRYGLASDGLVPSQEAEIPGSKVVRLTDMDHAESVMSALPGFGAYDNGALTQALVTLALQREK